MIDRSKNASTLVIGMLWVFPDCLKTLDIRGQALLYSQLLLPSFYCEKTTPGDSFHDLVDHLVNIISLGKKVQRSC